MRRCEDGIGILVAESGEQEGASEKIAPFGECGSDQICPQSAENRAAGLFRYCRTFAHEAQSLLIEKWYRRLSDSVFSSRWSGTALYQAVHCDATGHLLAVTTPSITSRSLSRWTSLQRSDGEDPSAAVQRKSALFRRSDKPCASHPIVIKRLRSPSRSCICRPRLPISLHPTRICHSFPADEAAIAIVRSMVEEQAQQSTGTSSLEKAAAGGLTAAPLVDDALPTASEGASAASVLSVTAFSPAGCVSKKMPVPAGTAIRGGGETEAGAPQTVQVHDRRNLAVP